MKTESNITSRVLAIAGYLLLTVLYGFALFQSVGNIVNMPALAGQLGLSINLLGWMWLTIGVLIPIIGYLLSLWAGRRQNRVVRLLVLATGLGIVSIMQLNIMHVVPTSSFFA